MSLLKRFFSKANAAPSGMSSETISIASLQELIPIRNFSPEKLQAFAANSKSEFVTQDTLLYQLGTESDSALYLLNGTVTLTDDKEHSYDVISGTTKAKFPLTSGTKHTTTAIAKTDVRILRVSQRIMSHQTTNSNQHSQIIVPKALADNRLLHSFVDYYESEEMEIPTLPDIAIKLRQAIQNDIDIKDAAKIIQLDPVISAKLVEIANCPLYLNTTPAKSCFDAVNRIGLNATRNLVTGLSLNHIFKNDSPIIKKTLNNVWRESLYISALCSVLAKASQQIDPEEALLAGLICNIGSVPFLNYASKLPKDYYTEADINKALPFINGPIGYKILVDWGFPADFIEVPIYCDDWYQNTSDKLNLTDIVVLSRLHSQIGKVDSSTLPAITSIPAASKLQNFSLSPEYSLSMLFEAKQQINEALHALS